MWSRHRSGGERCDGCPRRGLIEKKKRKQREGDGNRNGHRREQAREDREEESGREEQPVVGRLGGRRFVLACGTEPAGPRALAFLCSPGCAGSQALNCHSFPRCSTRQDYAADYLHLVKNLRKRKSREKHEKGAWHSQVQSVSKTLLLHLALLPFLICPEHCEPCPFPD